jgi:hypothetical protein
MIRKTRTAITYATIFLFSFIILMDTVGYAQRTGYGDLEKMPVDLETDFALSALPPHLRTEATVYLLDPAKGFYISQQGTNGFICFVSRTEWEWAESRNDLAAPISYDAEGARSIFPIYLDVAAMRASGKFDAAQIKDSIRSRIIRGIYKAPSKTGISYMLSPMMRVYPEMPDNKNIVSVSGPHYMFYAPYVTDEDLGLTRGTHGPVLNNPSQWVLGERKGPFGYIIMNASEEEKAEILRNGQQLLKRLRDYRPWFTVQPESMHHGN